jgi:serine protease AprX
MTAMITVAGTAGMAGMAAPAWARTSKVTTQATQTQTAVAPAPSRWGDLLADLAALDSTGHNYPILDPGSLFTVTSTIGARSVWHTQDSSGRAITGQGVTVALLDSGVAPVAGLDATGKVVKGPDLSLETNSPALQGLDTFGHGTHLAGIIGADDPVTLDSTGAPVPLTSPHSQLGVAPNAQLLALKLATTDGSTDVSQVIAALDWVSQHKNDNGMHVRVVNLSFGTSSLQPYQLDPLAAAAENAWKHGLVVVVSAGNDGSSAVSLTDPAIDPYVIAVGASDPQESVLGWKSPVVAAFSSRGTVARHADLLAPGRSIVSLRDPGSFVDVNHPEGLVTGDTTGRLFRGSGTSQAAAVVSGSVALLLQAYPNLTPDQVKAALVSSATPISGAAAVDAGAGELNVPAAMKAAATIGASTQTWPAATGLGSLELARGGSHLVDPVTGAVLSGEVDVQTNLWVGATWMKASTAGTAWNGGLWLGARWSGDSWSGANWTSAAWTGARWSGARWSDATWDGARWSGARWSSAFWDGARWSDDHWY